MSIRFEIEYDLGDVGHPLLEVAKPTRGPRHHREVREAEDSFRFAPLAHLCEGILSDDEDRRGGARVAISHCTQGVDEIGRTRSIEFDPIDGKILVARDGAFDPVESLGRRSDGIAGVLWLMGWKATRDERDSFQRQRFADLFCGAEMSEMDRIECATE